MLTLLNRNSTCEKSALQGEKKVYSPTIRPECVKCIVSSSRFSVTTHVQCPGVRCKRLNCHYRSGAIRDIWATLCSPDPQFIQFSSSHVGTLTFSKMSGLMSGLRDGYFFGEECFSKFSEITNPTK